LPHSSPNSVGNAGQSGGGGDSSDRRRGIRARSRREPVAGARSAAGWRNGSAGLQIARRADDAIRRELKKVAPQVFAERNYANYELRITVTRTGVHPESETR
jgi:hypothetical protein